jgi:hypothetical protein
MCIKKAPSKDLDIPKPLQGTTKFKAYAHVYKLAYSSFIYARLSK